MFQLDNSVYGKLKPSSDGGSQLGTKTITKNGTYNASDDNLDGYSEVEVLTDGVELSDYFESELETSKNNTVGGWFGILKDFPDFVFTGTEASYLYAYYPKDEIKIDYDTSNVTNFVAMFSDAEASVIDISSMNTSNATNLNYLFQSCKNLKTIIGLETLNFSKLTYLNKQVRAFFRESGLEELDVTVLDTSNLNGFYEWFYNCTSMHTLNFNIDASALTGSNSGYGLYYTLYGMTSLENLTFCTNYGAGFSTTLDANKSYATINLSKSTLLTHDSLMDVINKLYDLTGNGKNSQKLVLGETNLAKLTEEEIAIATNKGWTVS